MRDDPEHRAEGCIDRRQPGRRQRIEQVDARCDRAPLVETKQHALIGAIRPLARAEKPQVGLNTKTVPLGGRRQSASSNDNGDVSWVVPAGIVNFPASVPGIGYHEWKAAVTPVGSISHKGQVTGAKVLAASIIDLMTDPELVVFDEPSLGLSPLFVSEVFGIVRRLKAAGVTILLVEQNVRQTLDVSDYGYLLSQGRVVTSGDTAALKTDQELHKAYFGIH